MITTETLETNKKINVDCFSSELKEECVADRSVLIFVKTD